MTRNFCNITFCNYVGFFAIFIGGLFLAVFVDVYDLIAVKVMN